MLLAGHLCLTSLRARAPRPCGDACGDRASCRLQACGSRAQPCPRQKWCWGANWYPQHPSTPRHGRDEQGLGCTGMSTPRARGEPWPAPTAAAPRGVGTPIFPTHPLLVEAHDFRGGSDQAPQGQAHGPLRGTRSLPVLPAAGKVIAFISFWLVQHNCRYPAVRINA